MYYEHSFTAKSDSGWRTAISIKTDGKITMDAGSGTIVVLDIKDIRKIIREYNKVKKKKLVLTEPYE